MMKAIVNRRYGPPDGLRCENVAIPIPKPSEVLIRVRAASVNPLDWHMMRGTPYFLRLIAGLSRPRFAGVGVDAAGDVEAVGGKVSAFRPGDAVFGACRGAFAEFATASESSLAAKPDAVTYEHAATVPIAALTALQGLRDAGRVSSGQRVLVNGAAGGVGTFAVQIAKAFGAQVTGVCSTKNVAVVQGLGADRVIDYLRDDFTADTLRYDVLFDCVGNHPLSACRRVLTPAGRHILVGAPSSNWMLGAVAVALAAPLVSTLRSQKVIPMLGKPRRRDLQLIAEWIAQGTVRPLIDRRYSLCDVPRAIAHLETAHATGKVVIICR